MERKAYALLSAMESSWWYRGRASVVSSLLKRFAPAGNEFVLDYGAGNGGMYKTLKQFGKDVYGFEPDTEARTQAEGRGYTITFGDEMLAFRQHYGSIVCCDVMEHIDDDVGALTRIQQAVTADGCVVITVPAYQWMWSEHDVTHHHFRRYTRGQVIALMREAGFEVAYAGYWNMFLFPLAVITRLLRKSGKGALGLSAVVNVTLLFLIRFEILLMRLVVLPFGLSVVAVGVKRS